MALRFLSFLDCLLRRAALGLLALYQALLSPFFAGRCRFYPSCSQYAKLAFARFSFPRAFWLSARRLGRCHPLCKGGEDFPPEH